MKTFRITKEYITKHISDLLCEYDKVDYSEIISFSEFSPQSFVVEEKRCGQPLLFFQDVTYLSWITNMISDQIDYVDLSDVDKKQLLNDSLTNIETLLEYSYKNKAVSFQIYNQEFIDVIRRVVAFTLHGDTEKIIHTADSFNELADRILPDIIKEISGKKYDLKNLFLLSVASGISGLDLKGAPAATSSYATSGIPMKVYLNMPSNKAAYDYLTKLHEIVSVSSTDVFEWNEFIFDLKNANKLIWMTDDYIESHFDLMVIFRILEKFKNLKIEIIPKNGLYGNDLSSNQLYKILHLYFNDTLVPYLNEGRLSINIFGPRMGAANVKKFSRECVESIKGADVLMLKGCRIHEMLQGGINVKSYFAFIVSRSLSELTTGMNSKEFPIVLFRLCQKEYAFWGICPKNSKVRHLNDGRIITTCASTLLDHIKRKQMEQPEDIVSEFNYLADMLKNFSSDPTPVYQEMDMLSNKLVNITKKTYNNMCKKYQQIRHDSLSPMDQRLWEILEDYISRYIGKAPADVKILDVATGSGRDIIYAYNKGYDVFGVDNSDGFINILHSLSSSGIIPPGSFAKNDMRFLQFEDSSFDVVRHNASLLHLPIIAKGYTADEAISEAYRVLKPKGLLYIFVKKGNSLKFVDTEEGLGGRVFQFHTHKSINNLLQRNGFSILYTCDEIESRASGDIEWIAVIAQK